MDVVMSLTFAIALSSFGPAADTGFGEGAKEVGRAAREGGREVGRKA